MVENSKESGKRFKFSEAKIRDLELPSSGKRTSYYDSITPQLECRVTSAGSKTFSLYVWSKSLNEPLRVTLGRWPALTVEDARQLAIERLSEINKGNHPNRAKRASRDALTLGSAIDTYLDWMKAQERKQTTLDTYGYFARRFLSDWRNKKLNSITSDNIVNLRAKIRDREGSLAVPREKTRNEKADRKVTANRVLRFLSQIFNHSIQLGWKGSNPCNPIKPFPEQPTKRRLEDNEIGPFIKACDEIRRSGDLTVDYLLMCLFSGIRRRNVGSVRWNDISLPFGTWVIPDTKSNVSQKVYLSTYLVRILEERKGLFGNSEFVFPSESASGHLEEPRKVLRRVLKTAGIDPNSFTIHSLKHSFISIAYEAGINPVIVARMGGHKVPGITARYAHSSESRVREAYEKVAEVISKSRIVDLPKIARCVNE